MTTIAAPDGVLKGALDHAPDAVIILRDDGLIEEANEQTASLFGYARNELVDQEVEILVRERRRSGRAQVREKFEAHPAGIGLALLGRRKDGSEFPVEVSLSPMNIGNSRRVVCVVRQVAQQKQMSELRRALRERHARDEATIENLRGLVVEANAAADQMRLSNRAKDEYVGMVSHEIRSPLTTIIGNARLLITRPGLPEKAKLEAYKDIEHEGRRLLATIEDLIFLATPESNEPVPSEPIALNAIATTLVQQVSGQLQGRAIRINVESGLTASGHQGYVEHVLRNLVVNAAKYSPALEPIEIEARVQPDGSAIEVAVLDRGPGVRKEDADAIFNLFYRARSTLRMASGTGIGLSVCKRLIEKQGGRIWVEERPGGGSAFRFVLPTCLD